MKFSLRNALIIFATSSFVASLSFVGAAEAETPEKPTKLLTVKEVVKALTQDKNPGILSAEDRKWTYEMAIGRIIRDAGALPANSPLLTGLREHLAQQMKTIPADSMPDLQNIVYSEYFSNQYYSNMGLIDSRWKGLKLESLGYQQPKDESFVKKFISLNENTDFQEGDSATSLRLDKVLNSIETAPAYLWSPMIRYLGVDFMNPKYFGTITKWAIDHLDDNGKAKIADIMLNHEDFESPSDFVYLELMKNNKKNNSPCSFLKMFSSVKLSGGLATLRASGTGRVNLSSYLQSLPDEVTCEERTGRNRITKTYRIKDEIFSLGLLPAGKTVQAQNPQQDSPTINSVPGCRFTESHLKEPVLKFLNSVPQAKNTARQRGFFSSDNSLCHLEITGQRVNKPTGDDMFNVEMKYRVNSELVPVPIKNPLTKAQVLDLAKAWGESQKTGAAIAIPVAKPPAKPAPGVK